jgi:hypothetical protein
MRYAAFALILGAAFAHMVFAQESTAPLLGTVTDPTGAVIPAASVVARNVDTGLVRRAVAMGPATIRFPCCPIGQYTR